MVRIKKKVSVLVIAGKYLPGYKGGGPIRSLANLVDRLGGEFEFKIITADRDSGDKKPYRSIKLADWNRVGKAMVFYMPLKQRSLSCYRSLLYSTEHRVLYLNSFFSPHFTVKPLMLRRLRLIPDRPLIIAPRGEFSPGALGLKRFKKRVYLTAAKALGMYKGAVWQASSEHEVTDIKRWFGSEVRIVIAPNLPPVINAANAPTMVRGKKSGCLRIIFLSRIARKKNLDGALKMLDGLKGEVQFNIYGPIEDNSYWTDCQKIIGRLSGNIQVMYCGSVAHNQVSAVMRAHDVFLLPTLGENFGHVILEALCAGCPVLISDQTPWRGMEKKGVGWDLPLDQLELFRAVLQRCIDLNGLEYAKWSQKARKYGLQATRNDKTLEQNRHLFYHVGAL